MIWDDPEYADVVKALMPMEWEDCNGYRWEFDARLPGVDMVDGDEGHETTDFEVACIHAEFAVRWLGERSVVFGGRHELSGPNKGVILYRAVSWSDGSPRCLWDNGRFQRYAESEDSYCISFTDRHVALCEAMLAALKEEASDEDQD